jgi:hypothetical protein
VGTTRQAAFQRFGKPVDPRIRPHDQPLDEAAAPQAPALRRGALHLVAAD